MVMSMLERSPATEVFHETDPRAFTRYELKNQAVLDDLVRHSPAPVVVFKALCECQDIARLLREFAPARCVWIFRRYDAVVASHIRMWRGMGHSIAQIASSEAATAGWRGRGMSGLTRAFIKRYYHPGLSHASACALFWYMRNILFFEQALDVEPSVHLLSYDQLAAAPKEGAQALFEFLGLDHRASASRFVSPAVALRQPENLDIDPPIRKACERLQQRLLSTLEDRQTQSLHSWLPSSSSA